ncbi:hypothetical protein IMZ29_22325, partial [Achromobacter sp. GG226]|nr:hypothetical protein [Verticiella sp. GG226]
ETAAAALTATRARMEAARAAGERRDVDIMLVRQTEEVDRLARSAAQAQALAQRRTELAQTLVQLRMEAADLDALRAVSAELDALALRQSTAATRLQFALAGEALLLGEEALPDEGERWLTQPAELRLAGGGWLRIVPGGADLVSLADAQAQAEARRERLLRTIGERSLADAQRRFEHLQAAQRDVKAVERELAIHAPQGLPALESALADGQRLCERLRARLAGLAPVEMGDTPADPRAWHAELQWAQQAAEQAEAALASARQRQQKAAAQAEQLGLRLLR